MKSLLLLSVLVCACSTDEGTSTASLSQEPGQCGELETHVFGVYRAPGKQVTITVERPGRHALVVSAHDATAWTIIARGEAVVEGVYAVGIESQTVTGPDDMKIETDSREEGGPAACGYSYPYDGHGCDTEQLLNLTSVITQHGATSFHGCEVASSFTLGVDMTVSSNCDVPLAEFANCTECGGQVLL